MPALLAWVVHLSRAFPHTSDWKGLKRMIANPICRHPSPRSTQTTQAAALLDPELREQGENLLRDLAFVMHLTRKIKRQILAEESALAGVGHDCR